MPSFLWSTVKSHAFHPVVCTGRLKTPYAAVGVTVAGTGAPAAWLNTKTFGYDVDSKPVPYDPARAKTLLIDALTALRDADAAKINPSIVAALTARATPSLDRLLLIYEAQVSDIADFSTYSEKIAPTELVAAMNEYLSAMTDIIEAHGGRIWMEPNAAGGSTFSFVLPCDPREG